MKTGTIALAVGWLLLSLTVSSCGSEPATGSHSSLLGLVESTGEGQVVGRRLAASHVITMVDEGFESFSDSFVLPANFQQNGLSYSTGWNVAIVTSQNPLSGLQSLNVASAGPAGLTISIDDLRISPPTTYSVYYALSVDSGIAQVGLGGYNIALIVNATNNSVPYSGYYGVSLPPNTILLRDGSLNILYAQTYQPGSPITVGMLALDSRTGDVVLDVNGTQLSGLGINSSSISIGTSSMTNYQGGAFRLDDILILTKGIEHDPKENKTKKDKKPKKEK